MNEPQTTAEEQQETIRFRWSFAILPLLVFLASIISAGIFLPQLDGTVVLSASASDAGREISRAALLSLLLVPNVIFTLIALALVRLLISGVRDWRGDAPFINRVLPLVGNMPGLIQAVILVVILQVCLYNVYEISIGPFWVYAVAIMVAGAIILGSQLAGVLKASRKQKEKSLQEIDNNVR